MGLSARGFYVVAALAIVCNILPAFAQSVNNPGFENGPVGRCPGIPGWTKIDTPDVVPPGGFEAEFPPADGVIDFILAPDMPASPDGGQFALLRNRLFQGLPEGVSQSISGLTPGKSYEVTFYQANGGQREFRDGLPDQTGEGHFDVSFGGSSQSSPVMTFQGFGSQAWDEVKLTFVATNATEILDFRAGGDIGGGTENTGRLALDGIRVCEMRTNVGIVLSDQSGCVFPGGSLELDLSLQNSGPSDQFLDIWLEAILPNGNRRLLPGCEFRGRPISFPIRNRRIPPCTSPCPMGRITRRIPGLIQAPISGLSIVANTGDFPTCVTSSVVVPFSIQAAPTIDVEFLWLQGPPNSGIGSNRTPNLVDAGLSHQAAVDALNHGIGTSTGVTFRRGALIGPIVVPADVDNDPNMMPDFNSDNMLSTSETSLSCGALQSELGKLRCWLYDNGHITPGTLAIAAVGRMDGAVGVVYGSSAGGGFLDPADNLSFIGDDPSIPRLRQTYAHNAGHSLCLDHISCPNNLMLENPGVNDYDLKAGMPTNQIARIREKACNPASLGMALGPVTPIR